MNRNTHIPAVLALGIALALLLLPGLGIQGENSKHCDSCSSSPLLGEHPSFLHSNNLAYHLTQNEAQALAKQGWIHAAY